jgi:hypothetical protein
MAKWNVENRKAASNNGESNGGGVMAASRSNHQRTRKSNGVANGMAA